MTDSLDRIIRLSIERNFPDATGIAILELRQSDDNVRFPQVARVRWTTGDLTRIEQLLVKFVPAHVAAEQQALVTVLADQKIPTQRLLLAETVDVGAILVYQHVPGVSMSQIMVDASMRWELSAHGFTFARTLAKIHNVDWRTVVPWMGDPESLPEDLVDSQVDAWVSRWEERSSRCPARYQGDVEAAIRWVEENRPTDVSVSLCHGDFRPANLIIADDEVHAVVGWEHALVTDASYDLALLPFEVRQMDLPDEDADLLSQAIMGSYVQSSSRSLGNLQFFAVARLLTAGLEALDLEESSLDRIAAFTSDPDELFRDMRQAMEEKRKAFWKP